MRDQSGCGAFGCAIMVVGLVVSVTALGITLQPVLEHADSR